MTTLFLTAIVLFAIGILALIAWAVADQVAGRNGFIEFAEFEFPTDAGFEARILRLLPEVRKIAKEPIRVLAT